MRPKSPSAAFDELTHTFSRDQQYFDALLKSANRVAVARMLVYYKWGRRYLPDIRAGLVSIAEKRFPDDSKDAAKEWAAFLAAGVLKDVCLVPYLVVRGVFAEAGGAIRRSLEHLGVLTHLFADPAKAAALGDVSSRAFKEAFVREVDNTKADNLRKRGVIKRFAALGTFAKTASDLYGIVSTANVHGDSPLNVVLSLASEDAVSCGFIDRRDPNDERSLYLLTTGIEILCLGVSAIHGRYGKAHGVTPASVGEGGRYLLSLLPSKGMTSPEMTREIHAVFRDLGLDASDDSAVH